MVTTELIKRANIARINAYAPYSHFQVGASVLTKSGAIFEGCNVENASFGATICAERVAIGNAVSSGQNEIMAVLIVTSGEKICPPCGLCRQVIAEFNENCKIFLANTEKIVQTYTLADLYPHIFSSNYFKK